MTVLEVPHVKQSTAYSCGPACATIVLRHYGYKAKEKLMIKRLGASPEDGVPPKDLVRWFRNRRFRIKQHHKANLKTLEAHLTEGWPVIVAYQDHAVRPSEVDYTTSWDHGHYAVVVGFDEEKIYLADPSSLKTKRGLVKEDFLGRWRDITTGGTIYHRWMVAIGPRRLGTKRKT